MAFRGLLVSLFAALCLVSLTANASSDSAGKLPSTTESPDGSTTGKPSEGSHDTTSSGTGKAPDSEKESAGVAIESKVTSTTSTPASEGSREGSADSAAADDNKSRSDFVAMAFKPEENSTTTSKPTTKSPSQTTTKKPSSISTTGKPKNSNGNQQKTTTKSPNKMTTMLIAFGPARAVGGHHWGSNGTSGSPNSSMVSVKLDHGKEKSKSDSKEKPKHVPTTLESRSSIDGLKKKFGASRQKLGSQSGDGPESSGQAEPKRSIIGRPGSAGGTSGLICKFLPRSIACKSHSKPGHSSNGPVNPEDSDIHEGTGDEELPIRPIPGRDHLEFHDFDETTEPWRRPPSRHSKGRPNRPGDIDRPLPTGHPGIKDHWPGDIVDKLLPESPLPGVKGPSPEESTIYLNRPSKFPKRLSKGQKN